jgi:hypothetical protein
MLRIQIIGLALVAALVMSAVAAGSASAAHLWLINGKLVASPVKVHSHGLLLLTDDTAPGGATQVHCFGYNSETVGPHASDLVETVTSTLLGANKKIPCAFDKQGLCDATAPTAEAINLPWRTELTLFTGGELRDLILPHGAAGNPGWAVTCHTLLGNMTDKCTSTLGSVKVENVASGVLALFDNVSNAAAADCQLGTGAVRTKVGLVNGDITILSPGAKLTVQ